MDTQIRGMIEMLGALERVLVLRIQNIEADMKVPVAATNIIRFGSACEKTPEMQVS